MEEIELLAPLAFVIVSLIAGTLLKLGLTKINLPYTVGLFVLGMGVGVLNMNGFLESTPLISESITMACNLDPDLILNIFLPILIFSAAYELDVHIFKKTLVNSTLLAVPGMVIAMFLTAALMIGVSHFAPAYANWDWTFALMFGALISATDPVAVVALLGELGVSKRFSTLIDGESMLNDGTGIVLFMLMYAPFTSAVESADLSPVMSFTVVVFGGLAIGYLMARAFLYYATRRGVKGDALLQASVMILLSYITFILAQDIFKLSGVIALVMFGLVVAHNGVSKLDVRAQQFMKEFWGLLSYIANTLIFIIIGVIIAEKVDFTWRDIIVLFVVYIGVNIVRMIMIAVLYPIMKRNGYGISKRESLILTWGALRGALGLTLALMVSYTESIPEDVRRQVLLLTSGIVTMTLIINATTIKWLLRRLGLLDVSASRQMIAADIRKRLHEKSCNYLETLQKSDALRGADWSKLKPWIPSEQTTSNDKLRSRDLLAGIRMQVISGERQVICDIYSQGVIEIAAQRKLIGALDKLLDHDGKVALDERISLLGLGEHKRSFVDNLFHKNKWLRLFSFRYFMTPPIERYEVACGAMIAQQKAASVVEIAVAELNLTESQLVEVEKIKQETKHVENAAKAYIKRFATDYPEEYAEAHTRRAMRMLTHFERESIEEFVAEGVIDEEEALALRQELIDGNYNR